MDRSSLAVFLLCALSLAGARDQLCYECLPTRENNFCNDFDAYSAVRQACESGTCLRLSGQLTLSGQTTKNDFVARVCLPLASYTTQTQYYLKLQANECKEQTKSDAAELLRHLGAYHLKVATAWGKADANIDQLPSDAQVQDKPMLCRCEKTGNNQMNFCNGASVRVGSTAALLAGVVGAVGAIFLSYGVRL